MLADLPRPRGSVLGSGGTIASLLGDGDATRVLLEDRARLRHFGDGDSTRVLLEDLLALRGTGLERERLVERPLERRSELLRVEGGLSRVSLPARLRDLPRRSLALSRGVRIRRFCDPEDSDEAGFEFPLELVEDAGCPARGGRDLRDSISSLSSKASSCRGGATGSHDESSLTGFSIHDIVLALLSLEYLSPRLFPSRFFGRRRDFSSCLARSIPSG